MFGAILGDRGAEGVLGQATVRARRRDSPQRRVIEPFWLREIGTRREHQRAAFANIADDVIEINQGQDALIRIAIEDDEVEFLDLPAEEIGGRKGDQR